MRWSCCVPPTCHCLESNPVGASTCHSLESSPVGASTCHCLESSPVSASTCHFFKSSPCCSSTCHFLESSPVSASTCHFLKSSPVGASKSSPVGASTCHSLESSPCWASTSCLFELYPFHRFCAYTCHLWRSRHLGHCSWQMNQPTPTACINAVAPEDNVCKSTLLDTTEAIYYVSNGVVNLEEDECMPTVDVIIDDTDSDLVCGSNSFKFGSDDDDFDAHIDDDDAVAEVDTELSNFTVDVSTIRRVVPLDADDITCNEDDECKPTPDGVYDTTYFFDGNGNDLSTVHPDPIEAGIIIDHVDRVDTTIDFSDLAVDHCCLGCDDCSIADPTNTIGTTSIPTWVDLSTIAVSSTEPPVPPSWIMYRDGTTTRSVECGHSMMKLKSGNGLMMDSRLDRWYLVPCLRAANVLVALFGVVIAVGWAQAPTETPSNTVNSLIDRPFVHEAAIIELVLSIGAGVQNGRALLIAACILSLGYTLYYGGAQSTNGVSLPLGYGWYSGGERLPAGLGLSLNADWICGSVHCDIFHHITCWCLWPFVCITDGGFGLGFLSSLRRGFSIGSSFKYLGPLYSDFFVDTTYQQHIHLLVKVDTSSVYYACNEYSGCADEYDDDWYEKCWRIGDWDGIALGLFVLWFLPWYQVLLESSVLGSLIIGLMVSWFSWVLVTFVCLWSIVWHFATHTHRPLRQCWSLPHFGLLTLRVDQHSTTALVRFGLDFSFPLGACFPIHTLLASLAAPWIVGGCT